GTPIRNYLERIVEKDSKNGVNIPIDYVYAQNTDQIARDYQIFDDVNKEDWFSGSVYYSYLNCLMQGVSSNEFAPDDNISRAMAATLLNSIAGNPKAKTDNNGFVDATGSEWWFDFAKWSDESGVLPSFADNSFNPDNPISREKLAQAMYNCGELLGYDMSKRTELEKFTDSNSISDEYKEAVSWAAANGIFKGNANGSFNPSGNVTRAEMSMVLRNWLNK
ncbi:MAG: S-layer homology domain-containing protein, partial [Clostridia bacterium]|nr:S-layer homology domain-containing protein [Clostridia bacterium]